jgi:cyclophilin family peptidyl-prolyl cis-trans isomerase
VRRPLLILCALLGIAGCGSAGSTSSSSSASAPSVSTGGAPATTTATGTTAGGPCKTVAAPAPKGPGHLKAPSLTLDPSRTYTVTVQTNCGTFAFALAVKSSPKTSASFYYLVKQHFFDGLTFHRVVKGFVIQGGDPQGDGSGGPGYTVVEPPPPGEQYLRGTVAMAKTSADPSGASGSQFFVVTAPNASQSSGLTPDYAVAGKIVRGQDVVDAIGSLPTTPPGDGAPTPAVVIATATVQAS